VAEGVLLVAAVAIVFEFCYLNLGPMLAMLSSSIFVAIDKNRQRTSFCLMASFVNVEADVVGYDC